MPWKVNSNMPENNPPTEKIKSVTDIVIDQFPIVRRRAVFELIKNSILMRADQHGADPALVTQALVNKMKTTLEGSIAAFQTVWVNYRLAELFSDKNNEEQIEYNSLSKASRGKVDIALAEMMAQTMAIADKIASQASTTLLVSTCKEYGVNVETVISEINRRRSRKVK